MLEPCPWVKVKPHAGGTDGDAWGCGPHDPRHDVPEEPPPSLLTRTTKAAAEQSLGVGGHASWPSGRRVLPDQRGELVSAQTERMAADDASSACPRSR